MLCSGYCPPFIIYVILSLVGLMLEFIHQPSYHPYNIPTLLMHIVFIALWSGLLYWLCKQCYVKTAYVILLLPILIIFGLVFVFASGLFIRRFL